MSERRLGEDKEGRRYKRSVPAICAMPQDDRASVSKRLYMFLIGIRMWIIIILHSGGFISIPAVGYPFVSIILPMCLFVSVYVYNNAINVHSMFVNGASVWVRWGPGATRAPSRPVCSGTRPRAASWRQPLARGDTRVPSTDPATAQVSGGHQTTPTAASRGLPTSEIW